MRKVIQTCSAAIAVEATEAGPISNGKGTASKKMLRIQMMTLDAVLLLHNHLVIMSTGKKMTSCLMRRMKTTKMK